MVSDDAAEAPQDMRDQLEDDVLSGVFPPGAKLDERALAARFAVSRTPVREALFHLVASGLAEQRPRRGTFVTRLGLRKLVEMFEVMAELEGLSARLATRRATPDGLERLRATHALCRASAQGQDPDAYYYANEAFHETIREMAGQGFLHEQTTALQKRLRAYRRLQLRTSNRMRASFAEHDGIVGRIEAGDADGAAALMRDHVIVQGERFGDLLTTLEAAE